MAHFDTSGSSISVTIDTGTSSTYQNYTWQVPPGTSIFQVPVYNHLTLGPAQPLTLQCIHNWDRLTRRCIRCGETEKTIALRAPAPRNFNRYINASDLMEEFIQFLGEQKDKKGEVFQLPMELFIKWLIIRACEEDQEEPNVTLELPSPKKQNRCLGCNQFMVKDVMPLHNDKCANIYFNRVNA